MFCFIVNNFFFAYFLYFFNFAVTAVVHFYRWFLFASRFFFWSLRWYKTIQKMLKRCTMMTMVTRITIHPVCLLFFSLLLFFCYLFFCSLSLRFCILFEKKMLPEVPNSRWNATTTALPWKCHNLMWENTYGFEELSQVKGRWRGWHQVYAIIHFNYFRKNNVIVPSATK